VPLPPVADLYDGPSWRLLRHLLHDARDDGLDRGVGHEPERLASPQGDADAVGGVERLELLSQIRRQRAADRAVQPYNVLASRAEEQP
jgi:hypothetical protein